MGFIAGCGGRYNRGGNGEQLSQKFSVLTDDLGIENKADFLKAVVDEIEPVDEEEMREIDQAEQEVLKEVFGE